MQVGLFTQVRTLIAHEILLEYRHKQSLTGFVLFVISTVFLNYLAFTGSIELRTWNALFWITILFAATNAVAKSFMQESSGRRLYYYSFCSPSALILGRSLYNIILLLFLGTITLISFGLFLGFPIEDFVLFTICLVFGVSGISSALTMIAAIASKTTNSPALVAILGFPVIIPLLITVIKASSLAIQGFSYSVLSKYFVLLAGINLIILALSFILFPYLWRD